jgi:hypothetical protein
VPLYSVEVIEEDFDLTNNDFSYKPLKELPRKVPKVFGDMLATGRLRMSGSVVVILWQLSKHQSRHAVTRDG